MDFDVGRRLHPHHGISIEVLSLDGAATSENDLAPGSGAESPQQSAFDLCADKIRIEDDAAVQHEDNAFDMNTLSFISRHLNDLGTMAQIVGARDAACATFRRP